MRRKNTCDITVREEKVMETIVVSKAAFLSCESERIVSPGEFLLLQGKLIQKRWWFLQGLLLAALCLFLCHMETDYLIRRALGLAGPLFLFFHSSGRIKMTNKGPARPRARRIK